MRGGVAARRIDPWDSAFAVMAGQDDFIEAVKQAVSSALDERNRVDAETHRAHHDYVANLIECSRRRREIFDSVVKYVAGIGALSAIGFVGAAVVTAVWKSFHGVWP